MFRYQGLATTKALKIFKTSLSSLNIVLQLSCHLPTGHLSACTLSCTFVARITVCPFHATLAYSLIIGPVVLTRAILIALLIAFLAAETHKDKRWTSPLGSHSHI